MPTVQLPQEILDLIIRHIPEPETATSLAIPASHITTRTLYSCLFASKATYASSLELLYRKCLYIDSPSRVPTLVRSYTHRPLLPVFGRTLDPVLFKRSASTSMFLKPFQNDIQNDTIDNPPVVRAISQLFGILKDDLRRLVIDMPLRSYYPDEAGSGNLRAKLRSAFLGLRALEEFVSVRDELYLSTILPGNHAVEPPVWSQWSNLKRLALYNLDMTEDLPEIINSMPNLQALMLTRPDTEEDVDILGWNVNTGISIFVVNTWRDTSSFRRALHDENPEPHLGNATRGRRMRPGSAKNPNPPIIQTICVDGASPFTEARGRQAGANIGQAYEPRVTGANWAVYDMRNTFNDIRVCQEWVKQYAMSGQIWPDEREFDEEWEDNVQLRASPN